MKTLTPVSVRIWRHVNVTPACWLWNGSLNDDGYGRISVGGNGNGTMLVHRLSWEIYNGVIPADMSVCHRCDVRNCVNPDHLFLGTQADNVADMEAKGRSRKTGPKPEETWAARLDWTTVAAIRSERSSVATAKKYGISYRHLRQIMTGVRWREAVAP